MIKRLILIFIKLFLFKNKYSFDTKLLLIKNLDIQNNTNSTKILPYIKLIQKYFVNLFSAIYLVADTFFNFEYI